MVALYLHICKTLSTCFPRRPIAALCKALLDPLGLGMGDECTLESNVAMPWNVTDVFHGFHGGLEELGTIVRWIFYGGSLHSYTHLCMFL